MSKVFISYSRKDIEFAKRLTGELQKSDLDFWVDWEGIPPTVDWWKQIEKGIEEADVFLFLISPDSAASTVCGKEIDCAVKNGKRLIPLVVSDIRGDEAPKQLGHLNWIFFRESDDFDAAIQKLLTAIHTDYDWVQSHRRLQMRALEWERKNKENSFLLRGRDLQEAELQHATNTSKEPHPTDLQREYVFKSRQAADRQRRITMSISIAGIIALAALAVFGFVQAGEATSQKNVALTAQSNAEEQAKIALARQLAAQAQPLFANGNPKQETAVLLAIQSLRLYPASDAAIILQNNTLAKPIVRMTHNSMVYTAAFSPNGKYVVSGGCDQQTYVYGCTQGSARVWDVSTGREIARMTYDSVVTYAAFSPDGKYVISVGCDQFSAVNGCAQGSASIWEASTGREITRISHDGAIFSVAFSPDGRYVVSTGIDNTVHVWAVSTGKEIAHILRGALFSVAFSPDGKYVVSGGCDQHDNTILCAQGSAGVWEVFTGKEITHIT